MTRSAEHTPPRPDEAAPALEALRAAQAEGAGLMIWASTLAAENAQRFGGTLAEFAGDRLRKGLAAQQALLRCRSLEGAAALHGRHMLEAVEDYTTQTARMAELSRDMADAALRRLR